MHLGFHELAAAMESGGSYASAYSGLGVRTEVIPHGEAGTKKTLERMRELALGPEGAHNKEVRFLAQRIVAEVGNKDYRGEAEAIFNFMRKHVRYTLDPRGLEWVQTPYVTLLVQGQGDCDCHATSIAALAVALGHGAAFRTVKGDKDRPDEWSHVYAVIGVTKGGKQHWYPVDSTEKNARFGEDPPGAGQFPKRTWVIVPA
jgi:transglutaminase-like putative cysteine protease